MSAPVQPGGGGPTSPHAYEKVWNKLAPRRVDSLKFLSAVAPTEGGGHACVVLLNEGAPARHLWERCGNLPALAQRCVGMQGAYFGLAEFDAKSRKAQNAARMRVVVVDIDVGKPNGAGYASQQEALQALLDFCKALGIEPAFIVDSGAGIHAYFVLQEPAPLAEWRPVADMFKASFSTLGLKADPVVTADPARVMRLPGSIHKNGRTCTAYRVSEKHYTLDELREALKPHLPQAKEPPSPSRPADGLGADQPAQSDFLRIVAPGGCAWAARVAATGGPGYADWLPGLALAKHCRGGEAIAHDFSARHPGYDPDATQAKLDSLTGGPPLCANIAAPECKACPHARQIKTPWALGLTPPWLASMNKRYALVRWGSKALVLDEHTPIETAAGTVLARGFIEVAAFRTMLKGRSVPGSEGAPVADAWLAHPMRRQFEGVVFSPPPCEEPAADILNLWRGFAIEPKEWTA